MILAVAVINALITLIISIISSFAGTYIPSYLQGLITAVAAYIIPLCIYARTTGVTAQAAADKFYLKKCRLRLLLISFFMGACWQFVMVIINLPITMIAGSGEAYIPTSAIEFAEVMLVIGILPAVFEELLFRGIIDGTVSELSTCAATIFSSVMFSILHADAVCFLGYIFMGSVLTCIVRRSGSLYSAMLFHLANNVTALLLSYMTPTLFESPAVTIFVFTVGVIGFAVLFAVYGSITKKPRPVKAIKTSYLLVQNFISISVLLSIAVTAAAAVLIGYII